MQTKSAGSTWTGPEPDWIRGMMDAAREAPPMTPEEEARLDA